MDYPHRNKHLPKYCHYIGSPTKLLNTYYQYHKIFVVNTFKDIHRIRYESVSGLFYKLYVDDIKYERVSKYIFLKYFIDIQKERKEKINKLNSI